MVVVVGGGGVGGRERGMQSQRKIRMSIQPKAGANFWACPDINDAGV